MPEHETSLREGRIACRTERSGQVLVVEIDSPTSYNALSLDMLDELASVLSTADRRAGSVVLRGVGGTFCSGVDGPSVRGALQHGWGPEFEQLVDSTHRALRALLDCPVPVVAEVDGSAAGAGVTYALLADHRALSTRSRLRPGHLTVGAPLDGGASFALGNVLGLARALPSLLQNRAISAAELHQWGLTGQPVDPAELESLALDLAERAASWDRVAVLSARRLLQPDRTATFEAHWAAELTDLREAVDTGRLRDNLERFWTR